LFYFPVLLAKIDKFHKHLRPTVLLISFSQENTNTKFLLLVVKALKHKPIKVQKLLLYEKNIHEMFVKLTPVLNFAKNTLATFHPIPFCKKVHKQALSTIN